ncbi:hypothetical protein CHF27_009535 [Romboutsia maritimum]|uniref:YdbS-like PH domain-containing protein n=1 Tax=Romboutsia maritimum TaxID=2020948 RepID=A0A371IRT1_9FIRM|nr:PH domain-containing protein [Romboutsia maritimum]RDY23181.1 hypothetical protein CHF27_009535 [Romboutsia maritimum]
MTNKEIKKYIVAYNILESLICSILIVGVLTILIIVFKNKLENFKTIIKYIYYLIIFFSLYSTFIDPFIDIKTYSYKITDSKIEYTKGILITKKTIIPISRIQHVTSTSNPLLKKFHLVKVGINTATQIHELRNISIEEGEYILEQITNILYSKFKEEELNGKQ